MGTPGPNDPDSAYPPAPTGGGEGAVVLHKLHLDYTLPELVTGVTIATLAPGDWLLHVGFQCIQAFDVPDAPSGDTPMLMIAPDPLTSLQTIFMNANVPAPQLVDGGIMANTYEQRLSLVARTTLPVKAQLVLADDNFNYSACTAPVLAGEVRCFALVVPGAYVD